MAAPTPTVRTLPTGTKSPNGFPVKVTLSLNAGIWFWEKSVKPPSLDGGEPIPTSTQHNVKYHTFAPRALIKSGAISTKAAYDATVWSQIAPMINVEQTITHTYPDGSTLAQFGYVQKYDPDETEEGKQPEATFTFQPTCWDPVNQVEAGPAFASAHGT